MSDEETHIAVLEQKIVRLRQLNENLKVQYLGVRARMNELEHSFKVNPNDTWYLNYLMEALRKHELLHEQQEQTIKQYQEHIKKYEHFYKDYEETHPQIPVPQTPVPETLPKPTRNEGWGSMPDMPLEGGEVHSSSAD